VTELRAGIVGAGLIAGEHLAAYAATPGVRVVAVADPVADKAARLAARAGADDVAGLDELLVLGLDVVSICTPPASHADLTVRALEAGLSVLCEKPMARSLADAQRMVAAARTATGLLMIGQVSRFEPDHVQAKNLIESGALGQVQMMSHSMTTSMPGWSEGGWLTDPTLSGGPLVDLAVHSFDFLAWAAESNAVRVQAVGRDTPAGPNTYALVTVRYASGAMALVESSWAHPASHGFKLTAEFIGTNGRLNWSYDQINGGAMFLARGETRWFDPLGNRGFRTELGAFADAVRAGRASPVPAEAGYAALRTALASLESVQTGETIDLTTWGSR
jgi:predicted dehydrogenase